MKELDEITDRIDGQDEIIDSLIKKITDQEKREPKTADYTLHFEALQKIFEVFLVRYNKENAELKDAVRQLNISYPAEQIQDTLTEVKTILEAIRKSLPVKIKHEFDPKTKGCIIAGIILLIVTAIGVGLSGYLWTENNRLQAVDIKYRLLRQVDSISTKWADSIYNGDPDKAGSIANKLESGQIRLIGGKGQKKLLGKRSSKRKVKS
jgi:hypothetical protein